MPFLIRPMTAPLAALLILAGPAALAGQAPLTGAAYAQAEQAYRLQAAGDAAGALQAAETALRLVPGDLDLRRLKFDLLVTMGALDRADAWSAALLRDVPADAALHLGRAELLEQLGRPGPAIEEARLALTLPGADPEAARLTLSDLLLGEKRYPEALEALRPVQTASTFPVQSRLGYALLGSGRAVPAQDAFRLALAAAATPDQRRAAWSGLLDAADRADDRDTRIQALQGLRTLDPGNTHLAREAGYALSEAGRDLEALAAFRAGLGPGSSPTDYLDAAYAARKAGRDAEARDLFRQAVLAQTPDQQLPPTTLFAVRREVESLSRTWGGSLETGYDQGGLLPGYTPNQKVVQQGAEVYYQPYWLHGDRYLQVYLQGFANLYAPQGWGTGLPTLQPSLGVRVKPLADANLVLAAQRVLRSTAYARQDWLFRAAYSADRGVDLKPGERSWAYGTLYTESAYFLDASHFVQTLEARYGRSWRVGSGDSVVIPHLVLAGNYDTRTSPEPASGLGAGLAFRSWFRQTRTMAPASWVEASVQYREKLSAAGRGGGVFANLSFWF